MDFNKMNFLTQNNINRLNIEASKERISFGRKKELIKTSYGKCIYSGKIEENIREIYGVAETMVVGESKPYCGVLIWGQKDQRNEKTSQTIDHAVEEMNRRLSNPEKIKKWVPLVNNLNIENGDLTPNPKSKHNVLTKRCHKVIEPLYEGPVPDGYIHIGGVDKPE